MSGDEVAATLGRYRVEVIREDGQGAVLGRRDSLTVATALFENTVKHILGRQRPHTVVVRLVDGNHAVVVVERLINKEVAP